MANDTPESIETLTIGITKFRPELDAVTSAIDVLLRAFLDSKEIGRYGRIQGLCQQAQEIERLALLAASDRLHALEGIDDQYGVGVGNMMNMPMPAIRRPLLRGPGADQVDLVRELIALQQAQVGDPREKALKSKLETLRACRDAAVSLGEPTDEIDAQLKLLIKQGGRDAVDDTELLRGHQAGEKGREDNTGEGGARDPAGADGAGVFAQAGAQVQVDRGQGDRRG